MSGSTPLVPLDGNMPDWSRRVATAVNRFSSRLSYLVVNAAGAPALNQLLFRGRLPFQMSLSAASSSGDAAVAATGNPAFSIKVNSVVVGTWVFTGTASVVSITTPTVPANALFEIYAPVPQDATLADVSLSLAISR